MLDPCFRRPRLVARLRAGPFGRIVDEFAVYLHSRGQAYKVVQSYVRAADRFTRWLAARGMSLDAVDDRLKQSFLRNHGKKMRLASARPGLQHFLCMLRVRGIAPSPSMEPTGVLDRLMAEYDTYLRDVAGLASSTRRSRVHYARKFLHAIFDDGLIHADRLQPKHVHSFVARYGQLGHAGSVAAAASSLRRLIRWLQLQGHCSAGLILAVPSFRRYKHASLPKTLTDRQVRSLLKTFDRSSPAGRRDHAMTLCLVTLGLRVSEVVALTLDDIDWRNGTIRIAAGKSPQDRLLPLPNRIGQVLVDYLRHGRPKTACRSLFIRVTTPVGTPVSSRAIRYLVGRALAKVEGCAGWTGTHLLRHTAATRMYRRGASLKHVADILGHRSLETTALYAKVNLEQLAAVALPWPKGGRS